MRRVLRDNAARRALGHLLKQDLQGRGATQQAGLLHCPTQAGGPATWAGPAAPSIDT